MGKIQQSCLLLLLILVCVKEVGVLTLALICYLVNLLLLLLGYSRKALCAGRLLGKQARRIFFSISRGCLRIVLQVAEGRHDHTGIGLEVATQFT